MDVAIIGGGIAGLYAAKALLDTCRHKVVLFEAARNLGGRILSSKIPQMSAPAELGAMRFRKNHRRLVDLLITLFQKNPDDSITDWPEVSPFKAETLFFLRGSLSNPEIKESLAAGLAKYDLYEHEKSRKPAELLEAALERLFRKHSQAVAEAFTSFCADKSSLYKLQIFQNAYKTSFKYDAMIEEVQNLGQNIEQNWGQGRTRLHEAGFWNILALLLSSEAYNLLHDALGYESLLGNWNAAEAIPYVINDYIDNEYFTLRCGMGQLVDKLRDSMPNLDIRYGHALTSIAFDVRHFERLEGGPQGSGGPYGQLMTLTFANGARFQCNRVILAIPRTSLEELKVSGSSQWKAFRSVSGSVRGQRAFKCFLVYKEPWWTEIKSSERFPNQLEDNQYYRIFTDLPVRQVHLFPKHWLTATYGDGNEYSLVMASYSDAHYTSYWYPMLNKASDADSYNTFNQRNDFKSLGGDEDFERLRPFLASRRMVQHLVAYLLKIFDCYNPQYGDVKSTPVADAISEPLYALYKDWRPEVGESGVAEAGWHFWQVHHRREAVEVEIDRLAQYDGICIIGETYSDNQGWIEGALESTCRVLHKSDLVRDARYA
jgi:monoamine oxidase